MEKRSAPQWTVTIPGPVRPPRAAPATRTLRPVRLVAPPTTTTRINRTTPQKTKQPPGHPARGPVPARAALVPGPGQAPPRVRWERRRTVTAAHRRVRRTTRKMRGQGRDRIRPRSGVRRIRARVAAVRRTTGPGRLRVPRIGRIAAGEGWEVVGCRVPRAGRISAKS